MNESEVMEMVLFGSTSDLLVDINLILQYITLGLLVVGYLKRKPFKTHGYIMMIVTILTVISTLTIMAPRLVMFFNLYSITMVAHALIGIIAITLGLVFNARFVAAARKGEPLKCGTKTMMRLTFLIWLGPIIGGTLFYFTTYFP